MKIILALLPFMLYSSFSFALTKEDLVARYMLENIGFQGRIYITFDESNKVSYESKSFGPAYLCKGSYEIKEDSMVEFDCKGKNGKEYFKIDFSKMNKKKEFETIVEQTRGSETYRNYFEFTKYDL